MAKTPCAEFGCDARHIGASPVLDRLEVLPELEG